MERKTLKIEIKESGVVGELVHKAVQQKCFDAGVYWCTTGATIEDYGSSPIFLDIEWSNIGVKKTNLSRDSYHTVIKTIYATEFLDGFDLDKWISDNSSKKEETPIVYCVDLTWVKGEAREVISKAIQQKAFDKGYKWGGHQSTYCHTDAEGLYIDTGDSTICYGDDFIRGKDCVSSGKAIEISVNKALRGEYKSVK